MSDGQQSWAYPNSDTTVVKKEFIPSVIEAKDNGTLIAAAADLWIKPSDAVADLTYGRGLFWTKYQPDNFTAHDLTLDGVDFRVLPEPEETFDVVVFDPPYVTGGSKTTTLQDFQDRYGLKGLRSDSGLRRLMFAGMTEAVRVLKPKGILMVKCMDYINHDRFQANRQHIVTHALNMGMEQVDELVHFSGGGPKFPVKRQVHSRRVHSYLCIFRKGKQ